MYLIIKVDITGNAIPEIFTISGSILVLRVLDQL